MRNIKSRKQYKKRSKSRKVLKKLSLKIIIVDSSKKFTTAFQETGAVLYDRKDDMCVFHISSTRRPGNERFSNYFLKYLFRSGYRTDWLKNSLKMLGKRRYRYHVISFDDLGFSHVNAVIGALIDCAYLNRNLILEIDDRRA